MRTIRQLDTLPSALTRIGDADAARSRCPVAARRRYSRSGILVSLPRGREARLVAAAARARCRRRRRRCRCPTSAAPDVVALPVPATLRRGNRGGHGDPRRRRDDRRRLGLLCRARRPASSSLRPGAGLGGGWTAAAAAAAREVEGLQPLDRLADHAHVEAGEDDEGERGVDRDDGGDRLRRSGRSAVPRSSTRLSSSARQTRAAAEVFAR